MHCSSCYNSSLIGDPESPSKGQQRAGLVTLKKYSHFSGSEMDKRAFVVPHDMSTYQGQHVIR